MVEVRKIWKIPKFRHYFYSWAIFDLNFGQVQENQSLYTSSVNSNGFVKDSKLKSEEEKSLNDENSDSQEKNFQNLACSIEFALFTFWVSVGNLVTLFCIFTWSQFSEGADPMRYR